MMATAIESEGAAMNAVLYLADGPGPHHTAVFLHGLPGNERNLDLAQVARRAGWNALFFHYRGAWGSEGDYSFAHVLEDAARAVAWTRDPARDPALRLDGGPVALVGHSLGGFAALRVGAEDGSVGCVASLAGADLAAYGRAIRSGDAAVADQLAARFDTMMTPLHGTSGQALADELAASPDDFDVRRRTPALAAKPLLLVAGARDQIVPPEHPHALWRHWRQPAIHWFSGGHVAPFGRAAIARALVAHLRSLDIV